MKNIFLIHYLGVLIHFRSWTFLMNAKKIFTTGFCDNHICIFINWLNLRTLPPFPPLKMQVRSSQNPCTTFFSFSGTDWGRLNYENNSGLIGALFKIFFSFLTAIKWNSHTLMHMFLLLTTMVSVFSWLMTRVVTNPESVLRQVLLWDGNLMKFTH